MSRISCETAAQCREIAEVQREVLEPMLTFTVVAAVALVALHHIWVLHRRSDSHAE